MRGRRPAAYRASSPKKADNSNIVLAYWLIGREIQGGEDRAGYGKQVVKDLAERLKDRFGRGFSTSNLAYFRQFYQIYAERVPVIGHEPSGRFDVPGEIFHEVSGKLENPAIRHDPGDQPDRRPDPLRGEG